MEDPSPHAPTEIYMGRPPRPFKRRQVMARTRGTPLANPDSHRNIHTVLCYAPSNGFCEVYFPGLCNHS